MEKTIKKQTWLSVLFGINEGINNEYDDVILSPEQIEAQNRANALGRTTEKAIVTEEKKSSNNGGFSNGLKINSRTLGNMRNIVAGKTTIEEQVEKSQKDGNEKV